MTDQFNEETIDHMQVTFTLHDKLLMAEGENKNLKQQLSALQKKYDRLYEKAHNTRGWQREYKKYHFQNNTDRQVMQRHERELDKMLSEEREARKKKQPKLAV